MGWYAARLGEFDTARSHCRTALTLHRHHDNPTGEANTLDNVGHPHFALGQREQARKAWQEALEPYRGQGRDEDVARVQRQLDDLAPEHESNRPLKASDTTENA